MARLKFYAYRIENERISSAHSDLLANLSKRLNQSENAAKRFMSLNHQLNEYDLLSYYVPDNAGGFFGMMMRIAAAEDVAAFPENFFDKVQIPPVDIASNPSGSKGFICKDSSYFLINGDHLITTLPKTRIATFRTYINWFLEAYKLPNDYYKFSIIVEAPKGTQLKDIKEIAFSDYKTPIARSDMEETQSSLRNISLDMLKQLFSQLNEAQYLIDKKVLSAKLVLKFNKITGKNKDDEEIRKSLSAIMTPMADDDGLSVKLKNGKSLRSGEMHKTREADIEELEGGALNEEEIKHEMGILLSEINNKE